MEKIGNIEIYNDDEEIIEILQKLPEMEECDNMNILKYIQEKTQNADFGSVVKYENQVYSVYKFDKSRYKPEDAGLLMIKSNVKYVLDQRMAWEKFFEVGMMRSEKIYQMICDSLLSMDIVNIFHGKAK